MNQNQELKMQLLKEFAVPGSVIGMIPNPKAVDFCREAYKFMVEGDLIKVVGVDDDGSPIIERTLLNTESSIPVAVDLGLPSGTLWCDRNLGAKFPSDYGGFVSWGNTELHFPDKGDMDWGDNDEAFKDYEFSSDNYDETPGSKLEGNIDAVHDAATANLGEPWRMPTRDDFQELYDNCEWTRKTVNGINGYLVTSKINGNSIFLPCSGYGAGTSWNSRGSSGYFWSASFISMRYARNLNFNCGGVSPQYNNNRYLGFPVRPVQYRTA